MARTMFGPHVGERSLNSSGYFNNFNRNKRSATINLSLPAGRKVFEHLVAISDGLLENYSAGVMAGWGFDYEGLCRLKPDIVYLSMAGFGHSGPYADYQSYGPTVQACRASHLWAFDREPAGWGFSHMDHTWPPAHRACRFCSTARTASQYVDMSQVEAAVSPHRHRDTDYP
jgi:crotonobetainyl-CoA:carnitine CoA-transferase CaiB-like acyl-CoA transferase